MDYEAIEKFLGTEPDARQLEQLKALGGLYADWNAKINVISRKDIDNLYLHHVIHSLTIARFLGDLKEGTAMLDMGTGGGFPGVPLAIMYPASRFHLIDRIGKKVRVAQEIASAIGLTNVTFQHGDIGECRNRYDYVVSRAVMRLDELVPLIRKNIKPVSVNRYANGLICLKGGDLDEECQGVREPVIDYPVTEFFNDPYFETKKLIYVPLAAGRDKKK